MIITQKKFSSLMVFLFLAFRVFAADVLPSGMQNLADTILEVFTSKFVQVIFAVFFCGAAVAYGFNKDNEKIKRSAVAIGIASALIASASGIMGTIWDAAKG